MAAANPLIPTGPRTKKTCKKLPFVSVCTPTYSRRPFWEHTLQMFRNQTYPKDRMEWIIVDDSPDKIRDIIEKSGIPQIRYYELNEKISLGAKRNLMHSYCSPETEIIVYMDDDDYYMPERVEHAVDMLMKNPQALAAGSSEIYIVFKGLEGPNSVVLWQAGPYGPNHATAGTFAFRRRLLDEHRYEDDAALAEEKAFLKNYTVPFVQLDPLKTILVFSHSHNTFDKRKMLENPHPQYFKRSDKTVEHFIRGGAAEAEIKKFFVYDLEEKLRDYAPGRPEHKPDVQVQLKKIEKERAEMVEKMQAAGGQPHIVMQREGQPPQVLTLEQCANLLQSQTKLIDELIRRNKELTARLEASATTSPAPINSVFRLPSIVGVGTIQ